MQAAMQQPTSSPANLSSLMSAADLNSSFSNLLNLNTMGMSMFGSHLNNQGFDKLSRSVFQR